VNSEGFLGFLTLTLWLLPVGVIWVVSIYLGDILVRIFTKGKNKDEYKLDRYGWIIKLFLIVHLILLFRGYSCNWNCFDLPEYFQLWMACILLFLLVYIPFSIYAKLQYYKAAFTNSETSLEEHEVELISDGKQNLVVNTQNLAYFKSDDNYIDVFIVNDSKLTTKTFRATMKSLEHILGQHPQFVRVHRSYIVNLNYYNSFKGGANPQVALHFDNEEILIPVSRKYKPRLAQMLK